MIWLLLALSSAQAQTFALRETLPVEIRNPIGWSWATSTTVAEWLVDWNQVGDTVTWTTRLCAIATPPAFGAETLYPESFVKQAPVRVRAGKLSGGVFASGPITEIVGADDADGDGHPGISVTIRHEQVGEGQVYVKQQATLAYSGVADGDRIRGEVRYGSVQELLGASTWWLRVPVRQREAGPGAFELVPIADRSCAAVGEVWP